MTSVKATLHTFERKTPADATWQRSGPPEPAVVGASRHRLVRGLRLPRQEGRAGEARGRQAHAGRHLPRRRAVRLRAEQAQRLHEAARRARSFCVDDPTSLLYGRIVEQGASRRRRKSSEDMSAVPGLQARPEGRLSGAARRQGRLVHLHSSLGRRRAGTKARIGMPEERVAVLQEWSSKGFTAIAVVSEDGAPTLQGVPAAQQRHEQCRHGRPRCRCRIRAAPRTSAPSWGASSCATRAARSFACGDRRAS